MFPEAQDSGEGQHVLTRVRLRGESQARAEAFFPEPRPARTPPRAPCVCGQGWPGSQSRDTSVGAPRPSRPPRRLLPVGLGIDRLSALCCDHVSGQLEPRPAPPGGAGAVGDGQVRQGSPPACGVRGGGWRPATGGRRLSVRSLRPSCCGHTLSARPPAASSVTTGWFPLLLVTLARIRSEAWRPRCVRPGGVTGAACSAQVHCVPR